MTAQNLSTSLLLESPYLETVTHPFQRFYKYRALAEFKDRDRCDTAQEIYKILNWYDCNSNDVNLLEPDTFFASSHNLLRKLFKKYDNQYFVEDFKRYIKELSMNYEKLSHEAARYYRYHWMVNQDTILHYDSIVNNSSVLAYIEATHKIGNFMIIPKGFGFKPKVTEFEECPVKSLQYIQDNWFKYSNNYSDISFQSWKSLYILEDCYENSKLNDKLMLDLSQPFPSIYNVLDNITDLVDRRTQKIILQLGGF